MENQLQMRNVHDGITGDYPRVQLLTFYKPLPIPGMRHRERGGIGHCPGNPAPVGQLRQAAGDVPLMAKPSHVIGLV